ncbi:MAG TPA: sodium:proton antiporter [Nitrospirae bacterium]|nr:sodium:proton antiporter [Nitrospirota bacterium]
MEIPVRDVLLWFGLCLVAGYYGGLLANRLRLPRVSGYILAGIVMSPSVFHVLPAWFMKSSEPVVNFSLAIITCLIGGSLKWGNIKALGRSILSITLGEAELAFILMVTGTYLLLPYLLDLSVFGDGSPIIMALLFGALASPTDPTATLAVVHEYRTKGRLTTTVLAVAALDDALGIINFGIAMSVVLFLISPSRGDVNMAAMVLDPLLKILFSIALGFFSGYLLNFMLRKAERPGAIIALTTGMLLLTFTTASVLGIDELLSTMSLGVLLTNVSPHAEKIFSIIETYIEEVIFIAFFVISGAHVDFSVLFGSWMLVVVYIGIRFVGKYTGAMAGGLVSRAPSPITRNIGFALVPQGGIVVGLALMMYQTPGLEDVGNIILNVTIGATAIHEIIGPPVAKFSLRRAGELKGGQP